MTLWDQHIRWHSFEMWTSPTELMISIIFAFASISITIIRTSVSFCGCKHHFWAGFKANISMPFQFVFINHGRQRLFEIIWLAVFFFFPRFNSISESHVIWIDFFSRYNLNLLRHFNCLKSVFFCDFVFFFGAAGEVCTFNQNVYSKQI